jgi:putative membrane protein
MKIIMSWLIYTLAITITAYFLPNTEVSNLKAALLAALVLGLINAIIRPLLIFFTLPLTILTLGLFVLVINAVLVLLASRIVPGFLVDGFWWAMLFSLIVSVINWIISGLVKPVAKKQCV